MYLNRTDNRIHAYQKFVCVCLRIIHMSFNIAKRATTWTPPAFRYFSKTARATSAAAPHLKTIFI